MANLVTAGEILPLIEPTLSTANIINIKDRIMFNLTKKEGI